MRAKRKGVLALLAACLTSLSACGLQPSTSGIKPVGPGKIKPIPGAKGIKVTVGSKAFTEQLILGKIAVYTAEASGFDVVDMTSVPGSQPARQLMVNGETNLGWEYTGTAWLTYMGHTHGMANQKAQWKAVSDQDRPNGITWGKPSKLNNTYALAVREEYAKEEGIEKLSDIAKLPPAKRTLCVDAEFNSRTDGLNPLLSKYGIPRGNPNGVPEQNVSVMDTGTIYTATDRGSCNFGEVFSTDGRIKSLNLRVLKDDLGFFPAYNVSPVYATSLVKKFPKLRAYFDQMAPLLTDDEMREMNLKVDVEGQDPSKVAREWLISKGFVTKK